MDWPGNSPDLNPIENLWYIMKTRIADRKPSSKLQLEKLLEKTWYEDISLTVIQNLVNSMPHRIKAVIKNKGGITKY